MGNVSATGDSAINGPRHVQRLDGRPYDVERAFCHGDTTDCAVGDLVVSHFEAEGLEQAAQYLGRHRREVEVEVEDRKLIQQSERLVAHPRLLLLQHP